MAKYIAMQIFLLRTCTSWTRIILIPCQRLDIGFEDRVEVTHRVQAERQTCHESCRSSR